MDDLDAVGISSIRFSGHKPTLFRISVLTIHNSCHITNLLIIIYIYALKSEDVEHSHQ